MDPKKDVTQDNTDVTNEEVQNEQTTQTLGDVVSTEEETIVETTEENTNENTDETQEETQEESEVNQETDITVDDLGLPEELTNEISEFGFNIPEGVTILNEFCKEQNLSKEQRASIAKFYVDKFVKPQIEIAGKKLDNDFKALTDKFGSVEELRKQQPTVSKGLNILFGEDTKKVVELLATAGLSFNPIFYEAFHKVGKENAEDTTVRNSEFTTKTKKQDMGSVVFGDID